MEAFEEYENDSCNEMKCPDFDTSCSDCIELRRKAWNGALERLYKELDYSEEHKKIKDWIEKELGE